jgi:hypothetical protein
MAIALNFTTGGLELDKRLLSSAAHMRYQFETTDPEGRMVHMTVKTFQNHLAYRPMMANYLDEAKLTVSDPDHIQEARNGGMRYCRLGLGRDQYRKAWLVVQVYYDNSSTGTVATYHFMRQLPANERIIQQRALYIDGVRHLL